MDQPWGLSGPDFLQLYGAALFGLLLLTVAVALLTKISSGRAAGGDGGAVVGGASGAELGTYELAYLFGGVDRVADAAVAGLVEAGSLRVTRSRELHSIDRAGADEYQNKVLEWSWHDINRVRRAFRVSDLGEPLRLSLQRRGLVITESRCRASVLVGWLFPLLGLVGVARLLNGVAHRYPVGFLVLELIITAFLWAGAHAAGKNPRPTWAGERFKREWKGWDRTRGSLHGKNAPVRTAESATAVLLVAVGGVSAYPDSELAGLLVPPTSGGSGGAGGGSGGGGGGGGGGCGGGGG